MKTGTKSWFNKPRCNHVYGFSRIISFLLEDCCKIPSIFTFCFIFFYTVLSLYFWELSWMPKHIRSVNWKGFRLIQAKDKPRSEQTIRLPYTDMNAFSEIKKKTNLKQLIGNILYKSLQSNNTKVFCSLISMWQKL